MVRTPLIAWRRRCAPITRRNRDRRGRALPYELTVGARAPVAARGVTRDPSQLSHGFLARPPTIRPRATGRRRRSGRTRSGTAGGRRATALPRRRCPCGAAGTIARGDRGAAADHASVAADLPGRLESPAEA